MQSSFLSIGDRVFYRDTFDIGVIANIDMFRHRAYFVEFEDGTSDWLEESAIPPIDKAPSFAHVLAGSAPECV